MNSTIIQSVTKFHQSEETIRKMTEKALGKVPHTFAVKELAGGLCSAVYEVRADETKMVLKIASDPSVITMRHEKDYVATEAKMLETMERRIQIPAPRVLFFDESKTVCKVPYFFMSYIEGEALNTMGIRPLEEEIKEIKRKVAGICQKISSIRAKAFGIPALPDTYTDSNYQFVYTLFDMLCMDAEDKDIEIPGITKRELLNLISDRKEILDEVKVPCYVHTDTWDGNLMIKDGKLAGMVDFAAILYGDPLLNHDFHDFFGSPSKELLAEFGIDHLRASEQIRIQIYRIWQCLGMIVERGFREYEDKNQYAWVIDIFKDNIAKLKQMNTDN